jgi:hypothetical protein
MANQEHLDILAKGVDAWNAWRRSSSESAIDLSHANLAGVRLCGANFMHVNLRGADLERAQLSASFLFGAEMQSANLRGSVLESANVNEAGLRVVDFTGADLRGVDFTGSNLRGPTLKDANLRRANLSLTDLKETDFSHARVAFTVFGSVNLGLAKGLDQVLHEGPASIGLDSIYRSSGKIPESFLRGAGVSDNFISYIHSLTGSALDFYSCFISYSTKDQEFADRLHADLQAKGIRCWFAPHDIQGGRKIHEQIDEAIRLYDKLLLILSDDSMSSNWVKTETANARTKETQQNRQMLFPVRLVPFERIKGWKLFDADTGIDSAREIREYFIPDFSNWKDHDSYSRAFERLVRDLKATPEAKSSEA